MTSFFLMMVLASAGVGVAAGALAVPWLADIAMKRAYRRSLSWWNESLQGAIAYRAGHAGVWPKSSDAGSAGALGMWLDDVKSQAKRKVLTHERACALREAGIDVGQDCSSRGEREQARRCSFRPTALQRIVLALACGAWFAALPAFGLPLQLSAPLSLCSVAMAAGVVCDVRARMIPLECCGCLLLGGVAFQLLNGGVAGVVAGFASAAVVLAVCWIANRVACDAGGSVGQGDVRCMTALAVLSGPASLIGAASCYIVAGLFSLVGLASRRLKRQDGIPMAPFLTLWMIFGTVVAR